MDSTAGSIALLAFLFAVWLIGREFVCWYFKLNQISRTLEQIERHLARGAAPNAFTVTTGPAAPAIAAPAAAVPASGWERFKAAAKDVWER